MHHHRTSYHNSPEMGGHKRRSFKGQQQRSQPKSPPPPLPSGGNGMSHSMFYQHNRLRNNDGVSSSSPVSPRKPPVLARSTSVSHLKEYLRNTSVILSRDDDLLSDKDKRIKKVIKNEIEDQCVNPMLKWVCPNHRVESRRRAIVAFITSEIKKTLPESVVLATGSFTQKTYLPDSDIDLTIVIKSQRTAYDWCTKLNQALCQRAIDLRSREAPFAIRNLSFINGEVPVIKCMVNNVLVDITCQQVSSVAASLLIETSDRHVGKEHLFKRSVILLKIWCKHEGSKYCGNSIVGSSTHGISTYALNIMLLSVFNGEYGPLIETPFQALLAFFVTFGNFDWQYTGVTLYGTFPLSAIEPGMTTQELHDLVLKTKHNQSHILPPKALDRILLKAMKEKQQPQPCDKSAFPIRCFNVVDPLDITNNTARAVNSQSAPQICQAFAVGMECLAAMLAACTQQVLILNNGNNKSKRNSAAVSCTIREMVNHYFSGIVNQYGNGDGWRPDLLSHPMQSYVKYDEEAASTATDDTDVFLVSLGEIRRTLLQANTSLANTTTTDDDDDGPHTEEEEQVLVTTTTTGSDISCKPMTVEASTCTSTDEIETSRDDLHDNASRINVVKDKMTLEQPSKTYASVSMFIGLCVLMTTIYRQLTTASSSDNYAITHWATPGQSMSFTASGLQNASSATTTTVSTCNKCQWTFNGVLMSGESSPVLTIPNVSASDIGIYRYGSSTSSIKLAVATRPSPGNSRMRHEVRAGSDLVFSAPLSGYPPPSFQWRHNGTNLRENMHRTLRIPDASPTFSGAFTCVLCNIAGCAEWKEILVSVS